MRKILLTLGSIAAVAAPVASVVSCGDDKQEVGAIMQITKPATVGATAISADVELPDGATVSQNGIVQIIKNRDNELTQRIDRARANINAGTNQGVQGYVNDMFKLGIVTITYNISFKGGATTHFTRVVDLSKSINIESFNAMKLNTTMQKNPIIEETMKWMKASARYQSDKEKDFFKKLRLDGSFNSFRASVPTGVDVVLLETADSAHGPLLANATDAQIDSFFEDLEEHKYGHDPLLTYEENQ